MRVHQKDSCSLDSATLDVLKMWSFMKNMARASHKTLEVNEPIRPRVQTLSVLLFAAHKRGTSQNKYKCLAIIVYLLNHVAA